MSYKNQTAKQTSCLPNLSSISVHSFPACVKNPWNNWPNMPMKYFISHVMSYVHYIEKLCLPVNHVTNQKSHLDCHGYKENNLGDTGPSCGRGTLCCILKWWNMWPAWLTVDATRLADKYIWINEYANKAANFLSYHNNLQYHFKSKNQIWSVLYKISILSNHIPNSFMPHDVNCHQKRNNLVTLTIM